MPENAVTRFKESIEPFSEVFDQLCLKCVAIKNEDRWVSIYTCLMLNNSDDAGICESKRCQSWSELVALFIPYPTEAFEALSTFLIQF